MQIFFNPAQDPEACAQGMQSESPSSQPVVLQDWAAFQFKMFGSLA